MSQRNIINSNFWQVANAEANTGNITGLRTANFSANGAVVNLGSVANLRIAGGQLGNVLTTNGNGRVFWGPGGGGGGGGGANIQPALEFTVIANGINQSFTDPGIFNLSSNSIAPVYVNGVLLLTADFEINGDTLTVYGDLNTGDVVTAASTTVAVVTPQTAIAAGNSSIVITPNAQITMSSNGVSNIVSVANNTLSTTNFQVSNRANLGPVGNITITGGASGQVLTTDGAGNLAWATGGGGGGSLANGTTSIDINAANIALTVSGNLITTVAANGQTTTGNIRASGNIIANGNIQGNVINANAFTSNTVNSNSVTANSVITSNVTSNANIVFTSNSNSTLSVSNVGIAVEGNVVTSGTTTSNVAFANTTTTYGNTTTGNLAITAGGTISTPAIVSGTSNIRMPTSGNVSVSSGGNANVLLVSPAGIRVTGTTTLGNANAVSIGGGTSGQYLRTDGAGNLTWSSVSGSGTLANGNSSVDVTDTEVNITADGTANVLKVAGTGITVTGESNLGAVSGITITGGSTGQVLRTNGSGALSWVDINRLVSGNSNVVLTANGNVTISSAGNADVLTVTGTGANITGTANITGNLAAANVTANVVTANTLTGNLARIASGNSSVTVTANSNINFTVAGNTNILQVTGTGANIAGDLKITGNIQNSLIPDTNIQYDLGNATYRWRDLYLANNTIYIGNATIKSYDATVLLKGLSITANGNIDTSNVPANGGMYVQSDLAVGNVLTAGTANLGNLTVANLSVTGNLALSSLSNGNVELKLLSNANVNAMVFQTTNDGNIETLVNSFSITRLAANINTTSIILGGAVTAAAGISATSGTVNANVITGNTIRSANFVNSNSFIRMSNVGDGNISMGTGNSANAIVITANLITVSRAANFTGNINANGISNLSGIGNIRITGGANGQFIRTDGSGNLTWERPVPFEVVSGNSNVTFLLANGTQAANGNMVVAIANSTARLNVGDRSTAIVGNLSVANDASGGGNVTISNNLTVSGLATLSTMSSANYSGTPTVKNSSRVVVLESYDAGNFRIFNSGLTLGAGSFQPSFRSLSGTRTIVGSATAINDDGTTTSQLFSRTVTTTQNWSLMDSGNCDMTAVGASMTATFIDTTANQAFTFTAVVGSTATTTGFTMMSLTRLV